MRPHREAGNAPDVCGPAAEARVGQAEKPLFDCGPSPGSWPAGTGSRFRPSYSVGDNQPRSIIDRPDGTPSCRRRRALGIAEQSLSSLSGQSCPDFHLNSANLLVALGPMASSRPSGRAGRDRASLGRSSRTVHPRASHATRVVVTHRANAGEELDRIGLFVCYQASWRFTTIGASNPAARERSSAGAVEIDEIVERVLAAASPRVDGLRT